MENNIKELEIKNFKSIKHIKFNPKRVNVIIGKPNVGKSNILEAMTLMTDFFGYRHAGEHKMFKREGVFRYQDMFNLFYDEDVKNNIEVLTDKAAAYFISDDSSFQLFCIDKYWLETFNKLKIDFNWRNLWSFMSSVQNNGTQFTDVDDPEKPLRKYLSYLRPFAVNFSKEGGFGGELDHLGVPYKNVIHRYSYKHFESYKNSFKGFLDAPFGENLFAILNHNKELLNEVAGFIEEQGLEFVLDKKENKFIIQKKLDRIVYQVPYSNIADTLRHVIFYLAAIESNKDAVLIFEEPEVHSYPPYIKMLADKIVLNEENQYFISTHSPYMLNTLIDGLGDDELNVVLTYYEDYQTKIKILSAEELAEIQEWKTDIFFNIDKFTNHLQEK